jgi:hypothetical protein
MKSGILVRREYYQITEIIKAFLSQRKKTKTKIPEKCANGTFAIIKLQISQSFFSYILTPTYSMILVLLIKLDMSAGPPLATRGLQVPVHTTSPETEATGREREDI